MPLWKWSKTASSNATADPTINWAEGMAPSAVNDSARAEMAAVARWRDDISGTIGTGGSASAYTVVTNSGFDTLANMNGAMIAFVPHATSGASVTLNVDGLGAKSLRSAPGVDLPAGVLVQGAPYVATYSHATQEFLLHGFYGDPYGIPIGGGMPFIGTTAPNSSFVFPFGQAVSRTTYATLFAMVGTTYGPGDGSTTFNLPDFRGRVVAGKDDMGGTSANRLTNQAGGLNGDVLGATGGSETHTLTNAQVPATGVTITINDPGHAHTVEGLQLQFLQFASGNARIGTGSNINTGSSTTGITASGAVQGGGQPHNIVQPTIISNYILRII